MSDLISRKALIETIRKYGICGSGYSDEERINDVIDMIESEPSAQQWIPCSERMPEENRDGWTELVLSIKTGEVILGFWHDTETGFCRRFRDGVCSTDGVVAWMPLPPAFKGE